GRSGAAGARTQVGHERHRVPRWESSLRRLGVARPRLGGRGRAARPLPGPRHRGHRRGGEEAGMTSSIQPLNEPAMRMPRAAWCTAFSHEGKRLYACGDDPHIWSWDLDGFRLASRVRTDLDVLLGPDLHPSLERVAFGGVDGTVRVWDIEAGTEVLSAAR